MESNVAVIVDYKCVNGPNAGKIFRKRFERTEEFALWAKDAEIQKSVKVLGTRIVNPETMYWDNRWVANVAR